MPWRLEIPKAKWAEVIIFPTPTLQHICRENTIKGGRPHEKLAFSRSPTLPDGGAKI
jgi:hypothetical protein